MILENLKTAGVQQAHKEDKIDFTSLVPWPGEYLCAERRYREGEIEKRAAIFIGPEFGTVQIPDLRLAALEGHAAQRHEPPVREAEERPHCRESHQPPRRRGDEGVRGVAAIFPGGCSPCHEIIMPKAGERYSLQLLTERFADHPPPLEPDEVLVEAARCLYCFDAPCIRACPTHIDIPTFIRQILHRNDLGAAKTILDANIFGGSCARACPTEVLCEGACVDNTLLKSPVQIGRLQRHATDVSTAKSIKFYTAGKPTGKKIAIIGSGPSGLTCAHELRKSGHDVVVFEARGLPGGLNTLGIAAYKISTPFALSEIDLIQQISIDIRLNQFITADAVVKMLAEYDAVFLGIGLGHTMPLNIEGEKLPGVWEALDFIFQTHTKLYTDCEIGKRVLVIGAGNTAIDVATAAKRLGAEEVIIAYRRGEEAMPAFNYEKELALADGIRFEWFAQPLRIIEKNGVAAGVEFLRTQPQHSQSRTAPLTAIPGSNFIIEADMVVKALGQEPLLELLKALPGLNLDGTKVQVDRASGATSIPKLFAGGDCIRGGGEIVDAVQDGKIAAWGINKILRSN